MKRIDFSEEEVNNIIFQYLKCNRSMADIGKDYGVSRTVITRILKQNNVEPRVNYHKYSANYDIFETIDSNEKAYWLGFLAADGCNYQRESNASIILNIHQKDRSHLEKFQNFMNSNTPIVDHIQTKGFSNNTPMSKIVFNSKKMSADLAEKGVVPNKSLILQPPNIESKFYLAFILGYYDGDGSLYKTNQYNNFAFSLQGTKELLEWINTILDINLPLEKRNSNNDKNSYYIRIGGVDKVYNILYKLYNSSPIHLDRKYQIYKNLETVVLNRNIE